MTQKPSSERFKFLDRKPILPYDVLVWPKSHGGDTMEERPSASSRKGGPDTRRLCATDAPVFSLESTMRKCSHCGEVKMDSEFDTYRKNGKLYFTSWCRNCRVSAHREYAKRDYVMDKHRIDSLLALRDPKNSAKLLARRILLKAIKSGRVKRQPCRVCRSPRSQSHHFDYSKPLEVIWLCDHHHKVEHSKIKKGEPCLTMLARARTMGLV